MVVALLLASLMLSVTESHDHQQHHGTQDTTFPFGNVSVITYSGTRRKGQCACHGFLKAGSLHRQYKWKWLEKPRNLHYVCSSTDISQSEMGEAIPTLSWW
jgi:hypothetical protein